MAWRLKEKIFRNLANMITVAGLLMAIWLLLLALACPEKLWLILVLAFLIGLTDFFDGITAKRLNIKSNLGSALDRLRDKAFICPTLIILAWRYWPENNGLSTILITFTESLVVLMVLIEIFLLVYWVFGLVKKLDVSAGKHGRRKMFLQFLVVMVWLISLAIEKYCFVPTLNYSIWLIDLILMVAIGLGTKSLEGYYQRYNHKT